MTHAIKELSTHSGVYRSFVITHQPRTKRNPIARYHVRQGDDSYGKFDAQAQATMYIDFLHSQRGAA